MKLTTITWAATLRPALCSASLSSSRCTAASVVVLGVIGLAGASKTFKHNVRPSKRGVDVAARAACAIVRADANATVASRQRTLRPPRRLARRRDGLDGGVPLLLRPGPLR